MKRILALALLALLAGSSPAAADPISLAIGALVTSIGSIGATVGAFVTGLGVLGKALISIGLSLALSFVSSLFRPKPKQAEGGVQSQIQIGGDVPRSGIFGKQSTAGHIVYVNTSGGSNAVLEMVFAVGDGRHEGLSRVWVNGKLSGLTQPGADPYYVVDGFDGKLTLTFVPGTADQSALASLVASANPSGRWSTDHTLTGIAYIVARLQYDEKVFPNGVPQLLFEMEGLRLYDPRFDSTNGGTGSQRWDDPTTWAYSENPAIQLYNYQRGIFLDGERVLGMGLPASDLNTASYIAAANICDETVSLAGGGTETRYRCGFIVSDGMQHSEVIDRFVEAMGGVIAERAGLYTVFAGVAQTSVVTITDGDLVLGRPRTFSGKKSRTERVNAVFGTYSNPDEQWKPVAFPAFTSDTFEAEDGGERLAVNLDLAQVFSVTQAQRLAMIQRRLGRLQGTAEISLPFAYIRIEAGDWMTWQSARFGFTKVWQVVSARIEADQTIRLSLREIATSVFSWISGDDELEVAQPGLVPSRPPLAGGLSEFAASPVTIEGDNGSAAPAIRASWNPIEDETVAAVIIEHRIGASGEAGQTRSVNRLGGFVVISDGIQPNTVYQVRGTIETVPARETTWSSWVSVTTPDVRITEGELDDAITAAITTAGTNAARALQDAQDLIAALSADANRSQPASARLNLDLSSRLEQLSGAVLASQAAVEDFKGVLGDLGWERIGPGGASRFRAIDVVNNGLTTLTTQINLLAGRVDFILAAETGDLSAIDAQLTTIIVTLDALQGLVDATVTDVNTAEGSIDILSARISAAEEQITLLASSADLEELQALIEAAQIALSSGTITAETIAGIQRTQEQIAEGVAGLIARLQGLSDQAFETAASTRLQLTSSINALGQAVARFELELVAAQGNSSSELLKTSQALAGATAAVASDLSNLTAAINNPTTGLASKASESSVVAVQAQLDDQGEEIGALGVRADTLEATAESLATSLAAKASISSVETVQATVDAQGDEIEALTATVESHTSQIGDNTSAIETLESTAVTESEVTTLVSTQVSAATAAYSGSGYYRVTVTVDDGGALSTLGLGVSATTGGTSADAGIEMAAVAKPGGGTATRIRLKADYTQFLDTAGVPFAVFDGTTRTLYADRIAEGTASKAASYSRDSSLAAFSPGTGANSGTSGNGWADIVLASGIVFTANTGGVIGATGSKLLVRGDQTVNANTTTGFPSASAGSVPTWQDYWFELWVRIVLRPSGGGADIEITPPAKFRSIPQNDGFTVSNLMPELLNDVPTTGSAVIDAGTYSLIVQHRVGRTGSSLVGNTMSVKMRGIFTIEAKLR